MNLQPFVSVDGTPFSVTQDEIRGALGEPAKTIRNGVGLNELDYETVVFRFQDCGKLEEITTQASVVDLGAVAVPFAALQNFVRDQDPLSFERVGFLISPRFGLAFAPDCPAWVTALAAHCIESWREL